MQLINSNSIRKSKYKAKREKDLLVFMNKLLKRWGGNEGGVLAVDGTGVTFAAVHLHDSC